MQGDPIRKIIIYQMISRSATSISHDSESIFTELILFE